MRDDQVTCPHCSAKFVPALTVEELLWRRSSSKVPWVVGNEMSYAAACSILAEVDNLRSRVFKFVRRRTHQGATCDEIEIKSKGRHQTISPRLWELSKMGMVYTVGTRVGRSGRKQGVWFAREFGPDPKDE